MVGLTQRQSEETAELHSLLCGMQQESRDTISATAPILELVPLFRCQQHADNSNLMFSFLLSSGFRTYRSNTVYESQFVYATVEGMIQSCFQ